MKKMILSMAAVLCAVAAIEAQPLAGTDDLGRTLLQNDAVGDPQPGKQVGMFYFMWMGDAGSRLSENVWDLSKIVPEHPEVLEDFDNPNWGTTKSSFYFWGEPIYGYFASTDYWVHLRSMQLLADAQVDFVVIDATNAYIYGEQADALMKAMEAVMAQGRKAPKIVFYTNTNSGERMQQAYDTFYKPDSPYYHPDCWYYLDGKPLIIGLTAQIGDRDYADFFTFRESQWPNEPDKVNGWPWISFNRPQKVYSNAAGEREIINVSVAQHPDWEAGMGGSAFYGDMDNWGRSYHNGSHGDPETDIFYGYNFQEQWDYALQQDVPFVFVTGWNEWVAGRWGSMDDNPEHSWFCDQASPEYSRDIEPTLTAGMKDNYYMQLVNNVRRYKGVERNPEPGPAKTIVHLSEWDDVPANYSDYTGDTAPRYHLGAQSNPKTLYTNYTGRNDFSVMKVANDADNLYLYAETVYPITPAEGDNWMTLYIDADRNADTGWCGYDYRVTGTKSQRYEKGVWYTNVGTHKTELSGNQFMIAIQRSSLKLLGEDLDFEFKWSDNMQQADPLDWYVNGDAAPGGRFNYIYTAE